MSSRLLPLALAVSLVLAGCSVLPGGGFRESRFQGVVVDNFREEPASLTLTLTREDRSATVRVELPGNEPGAEPPSKVVLPPRLLNTSGPVTVGVGFAGNATSHEFDALTAGPCYVVSVTVTIPPSDHGSTERRPAETGTGTPTPAVSPTYDPIQFGTITNEDRCLSASEAAAAF